MIVIPISYKTSFVPQQHSNLLGWEYHIVTSVTNDKDTENVNMLT